MVDLDQLFTQLRQRIGNDGVLELTTSTKGYTRAIALNGQMSDYSLNLRWVRSYGGDQYSPPYVLGASTLTEALMQLSVWLDMDDHRREQPVETPKRLGLRMLEQAQPESPADARSMATGKPKVGKGP